MPRSSIAGITQACQDASSVKRQLRWQLNAGSNNSSNNNNENSNADTHNNTNSSNSIITVVIVTRVRMVILKKY